MQSKVFEANNICCCRAWIRKIRYYQPEGYNVLTNQPNTPTENVKQRLRCEKRLENNSHE